MPFLFLGFKQRAKEAPQAHLETIPLLFIAFLIAYIPQVVFSSALSLLSALHPARQGTSVSLYSVVNEPGGLFFLSPFIPHFFQILQPVGENFFQGKFLSPYIPHFFHVWTKKYQTFLQKNGLHSLSFDNQIKKYLSRNLFSDKEKAEKENRIG